MGPMPGEHDEDEFLEEDQAPTEEPQPSGFARTAVIHPACVCWWERLPDDNSWVMTRVNPVCVLHRGLI